jgi:hypothetical protein
VVENRLRIKKTAPFDQRRTKNPKNTHPFRAPPKWRSHFILAAQRTTSDALLADPTSLFDRRIDFVFFRGPSFVPAKAEPFDMVLNRAQPPLWSSDHAALAAELLIEPAPCDLHRK